MSAEIFDDVLVCLVCDGTTLDGAQCDGACDACGDVATVWDEMHLCDACDTETGVTA